MQLPFEVEHQLAWIIAGCFALLSACITAYQVWNHIKYNSHPTLRRYVIRIILMVPIYALESWLGLRFAGIALYFDLLRECYEAFVIYSFFQLLVTYLGGERALVSILAHKPNHPHVFPFCLFQEWRMSDRFQIQFTESEMARLQKAMDERQKARGRTRTTSAVRNVAEVDEEKGLTSPSADTKWDQIAVASADNGTSPASSSPSSPPPSNTSPDYSGAASSPSLLPPTGHKPEIPIFSSQAPRIPPSYMSPYSRPHHSDFLTHVQLGTLQYCIAKPVTALLAFILSLLDLYGDSNFDWSKGYPYLAFITNMSQIWAMYTLVLFYMVCKDDLKGLRPIPKFLCVKAVVFFTFWQSVLIAILASFGILHETTNYTQAEVVVALQDFIVCIEMLLAALAHHYAFSWKEFHDPEAPIHRTPGRPMLPALIEALNVSDVYVQDVRRVTAKSLKKKGKHNPVLTTEELHEMQYESFVTQTMDNHDYVSRPSDDLREPLNPDGDSEDLVDEETGRTYITPVLNTHPISSTSTTSSSSSALIHPTHTQRVEHAHELHRISADSSDGRASTVATITTDIVTVASTLDDDLLAPPSLSHHLRPSPATDAVSQSTPSQVTFELVDNGHDTPTPHTTSSASHIHPIIDEPVQSSPHPTNDDRASNLALPESSSSAHTDVSAADDLPPASLVSNDRDQNEVESEESAADSSAVTSSTTTTGNQGKKKKGKNKKR